MTIHISQPALYVLLVLLLVIAYLLFSLGRVVQKAKMTPVGNTGFPCNPWQGQVHQDKESKKTWIWENSAWHLASVTRYTPVTPVADPPRTVPRHTYGGIFPYSDVIDGDTHQHTPRDLFYAYRKGMWTEIPGSIIGVESGTSTLFFCERK